MRRPSISLIFLLLIALGVFAAGINWGLPSRNVDPFLFGERKPWTGQDILNLLPKEFDPTKGADVDATPLNRSAGPIWLNETDTQRAEIVRRYRLFSYQPDEMITFMSLAQMKRGQLQLDPKLYQYGGLWIYPVGALLKISSMLHLVKLESDQAFYLDHPEEFGKFYIVARAYVVLWALVGVWAIHTIAYRLLQHPFPAFCATLCCIFLPVVVNMAHEAKPHLPGAVLVLLAVIAATNYVQTSKTRWAILASIFCGAAGGMVISCLSSFILLPVMAFLCAGAKNDRIKIALLSIACAVGVYAITNPYVLHHLLVDRATLQSNLGNSGAMYAWSFSGKSFSFAALRLTQAMTLPVVVLSAIAVLRMFGKRNPLGVFLAVVCVPVLIQFVGLAADKPAEYARFALLPAIVLTLAVFCLISNDRSRTILNLLAMLLLTAVTGVYAAGYVWHFGRDSVNRTPRIIAAERLKTRGMVNDWVLSAEPAPYSLPPMNLFTNRLYLGHPPDEPGLLVGGIHPTDLDSASDLEGKEVWGRPRLLNAPISWAAKPFAVWFEDGNPDVNAVETTNEHR